MAFKLDPTGHYWRVLSHVGITADRQTAKNSRRQDLKSCSYFRWSIIARQNTARTDYLLTRYKQLESKWQFWTQLATTERCSQPEFQLVPQKKNKFAVKYDWTDQRSHIRGSSSSKKHEDQQQIFPIPIGDELRQPNEQQ